MAGEVTVPLLPCGSIDAIGAFYEALGFAITYRQERPTPSLIVRREDLELHFFGMPDWDPASSYSSCLVVVADTAPLYEAFAAGMRSAFGKVPTAGIPRMTRPRRRQGNTMGFTVVDPGGNWIRIVRRPDLGAVEPRLERGTLTRALYHAGVIGDSKGDPQTAAAVLDRALAQDDAAPAVERYEALVYRAELAIALCDRAGRDAFLIEAHGIELSDGERVEAREAIARARDLA